jgi:hypothetical protein
MDRIRRQSPRQRGYGSTSSLRNDSLKHTRKHERRREESNQEAKHIGSSGPSGQKGRTVRTGHADRPACRRGPSTPTPRTVRPYAVDRPIKHTEPPETPRTMDRPRGARGLSARHPRTVRPTHADRPKLRPTKTQNHDGSKRKASKNTKNTRRTRAARTVCQDDADRPRGTDRAEKQPTSKVNSPKSSSDFPNG